MAIDMDAIMILLSWAMDAFEQVYDWLSFSVSEFLELVLGWIPFIGDGLADFLASLYSNVVIFGVPLSDITIIAIMLGGGLFFYIVYQFFTWIVNLVT